MNSSTTMISLLTFIAGIVVVAQAAYDNEFDGVLNFQCPKNTQSITRVQSIHDNGAEDRKFDLTCSDLPLTSSFTPACYWTDYQNQFDELLAFSCPTNYYIAGMNSIHNSDNEDRRWKFYCCALSDIHMSDCSFSGWTNDFDKVQDYTLPPNQVMKGVISRHDNGPEDRIFKYESCAVYKSNCDVSVVG